MDDTTRPVILVAEQDEDDRAILKAALAKRGVNHTLRFVNDGQELTEYLLRSGGLAGSEENPRPAMILLELDMPRKGGLEALEEIKRHACLSSIPVVVWTESTDAADRARSLELGASSVVTKSPSFEGMSEALGKAIAKASQEAASISSPLFT